MHLRYIFFTFVLIISVTTAQATERTLSYNSGEESVPATSNQDDPNNTEAPPYVAEAEKDSEENEAEKPATATANTPPEPEVILPQWAEAKGGEVKALNKVYLRNKLLKLKNNGEEKFGALKIKMKKCFRKPESDKKESAALLQITETQKDKPAKELFHGWMFSSSPALSALEHPLYDVILLSCDEEIKEIKKEDAAKTEKETKKK